MIALAIIGNAAVIIGRRKPWIERDGLSIIFDGADNVAFVLIGDPPVAIGPCIPGIQR